MIKRKSLELSDIRFQRSRNGRIGVMIREISVHIAIHFDDLAPHLSKEVDTHFSADAIPGIHNNFEFTLQFHVAQNTLVVLGQEV